MYKYRVRIDTYDEVKQFVKTAELYPVEVGIVNGDGTKQGAAKTMINVLESVTWDKVYITCDQDCYMQFKDFIAE